MSKKMRPQRKIQAPPRFNDFIEFTSSSDDLSNSIPRRGIVTVVPTGGSVDEDLQNMATSMSTFREESMQRPTLRSLQEKEAAESIGGLIAHATSVLNGGNEYSTNEQGTMDIPLILGQHITLSNLSTNEQQASRATNLSDFFNAEIPIDTRTHGPSSVPNPVRRDVLFSTVEARDTTPSSRSTVLPRIRTDVRTNYKLNIMNEMENLFNDEIPIASTSNQKADGDLFFRNDQQVVGDQNQRSVQPKMLTEAYTNAKLQPTVGDDQEIRNLDSSQTCSLQPSMPVPIASSPMSQSGGHISEAASGKRQQSNTNRNGSYTNEEDEHCLNNDKHEEQVIIQKNQLQTSRANEENGHDNHGSGSISTAFSSCVQQIDPSLLQSSTNRSDEPAEMEVRTEQQIARDQNRLVLQMKMLRQANLDKPAKSSVEYDRERLPVASSGMPPCPKNKSTATSRKNQQPNSVLGGSREDADNERFINADENGEQPDFQKDQLQDSRHYNKAHDNRRDHEFVPISTPSHSFIEQQISGPSSTQCGTTRSAGDRNHQPLNTTVGHSCYDDHRGALMSQLAGSNSNWVTEQFFNNLLEVFKAHDTMCKEEFGILKQQIKKLREMIEREFSGEFPERPDRLPISSCDGIVEVDTISSEEYKQIVGYLAALGGGNIGDTANEIIKHAIKDALSPKVTWYGRHEGTLELGKTRLAKAMYGTLYLQRMIKVIPLRSAPRARTVKPIAGILRQDYCRCWRMHRETHLDIARARHNSVGFKVYPPKSTTQNPTAAIARNRAFPKPTWTEFSNAMIAGLKCSKQRNRVAKSRRRNRSRSPSHQHGRRSPRSTGDETPGCHTPPDERCTSGGQDGRHRSRRSRDKTHRSRSPRDERRTSGGYRDRRRRSRSSGDETHGSRSSRDETRKSRSPRNKRHKSHSSRDETRYHDSRDKRRGKRDTVHEENRPGSARRRRRSGQHEDNNRDGVEIESVTDSDI